MVRFELNIGRVDRVGPADIVSSVANRCKIPGKNIGAIDILSDVSYFDIKEEYAKIAEKHLKQVKIRGKKVTAKQMK
ncbi:DbpA RNA binding domain-containing protein [Filifactor alocis]